MDETGVTRHSSEAGAWEAAVRMPHRALCEAIRGPYVGFVERGTSFAARREVPHGDIVIILNLGPRFRVRGPGYGRHPRTRFGSFVAGLHDVFVLTESPGSLECIELRLTPIGAHRLLGLPMHELTNRIVAPAELWGARAAHLIERLGSAVGWAARFALLDRFLLRRLAEVGPPAAAPTTWAWRCLDQAMGQVTIRDLARTIGWSRKHLAARFREEVGMTPKRFARVLRFQRAVALLDGSRAASWAEIAFDAGYYDQAHLNRDFRALAGVTPSAFLASRLPDGGGFVAEHS